MYLYLYDSVLREKRYQSIMKEVENRLTDFGITGKIIRLTSFHSARPLIEDEISRGVKTVIMVGTDATFGHVLSTAAPLKVTFGFIPLDPKSVVARILGMPLNEDACDVISARKIENLDIGWMNNRHFLSQVHMGPAPLTVEYDEKFTVHSQSGAMKLTVCNLLPFGGNIEYPVHPQDGHLDAFIETVEKTSWFSRKGQGQPASVFPFQSMVVRSKTPFVVNADGRESKEIKLTIRLAKEKLKMIVGKDRAF